jgi:hypothetical protein
LVVNEPIGSRFPRLFMDVVNLSQNVSDIVAGWLAVLSPSIGDVGCIVRVIRGPFFCNPTGAIEAELLAIFLKVLDPYCLGGTFLVQFHFRAVNNLK